LVTEVVKERQSKRDKAKTSIIGTLIEDAMMEFTSLEPDGKSNKSFRTLHSTTSSLASRPLDTFEDVQDWAKDLSLDPAIAGTSGFAAGNLAALEDQTSMRGGQLPPLARPDMFTPHKPPPRVAPPQPGLPRSPGAASAPSHGVASPAPLPAPYASAPHASAPYASAPGQGSAPINPALEEPPMTRVLDRKPNGMSGGVMILVAILVLIAAALGAKMSGLF